MLEEAPDLRTVGIFEELMPASRTGRRRAPHPGTPRAGVAGAARSGTRDRVPPEPSARATRNTDFTDAGGLRIAVAGEPLDHLLYLFRLAYFGFSHVHVVLAGESFAALAEGLRQALRTLGGVPREHRSDSLSTAYRNLDADGREDATARYAALCAHYGMAPTRNNRGEWHENGAPWRGRTVISSAPSGMPCCCAARATSTFWPTTAPSSTRWWAGATAIGACALTPSARCCRRGAPTTSTRFASGSFVLRRVFYSVPYDHLELFLGATPLMTLARGRVRSGGRNGHVVDYRHVIPRPAAQAHGAAQLGLPRRAVPPRRVPPRLRRPARRPGRTARLPRHRRAPGPWPTNATAKPPWPRGSTHPSTRARCPIPRRWRRRSRPPPRPCPP